MKKLLYLILIIFIGAIFGYSYHMLTMADMADKFIELRTTGNIQNGNLNYVFDNLSKDYYFLKLKSSIHKQIQPQFIYFNSYPVIFNKSKRLFKRGVISAQIPANSVKKGSNLLKIIYPQDVTSQVKIILKNYRKCFNQAKVCFLFTNSRFFYPPYADYNLRNTFIDMLGAAIMVIFLASVTYLILFLLNLPLTNFIKIEKLSLTICAIAVALLDFLFLIGPFKIVFEKSYFIQVVLFPLILLQIFLYLYYQEQEKVNKKKLKKRSIYLIRNFKSYFARYNLSNRLIILFIISLLLCPIFLIAGFVSLANFFAFIAYLFVVIATLIKLVELFRNPQGKENEK